jgi:hypothetical protein
MGSWRLHGAKEQGPVESMDPCSLVPSAGVLLNSRRRKPALGQSIRSTGSRQQKGRESLFEPPTLAVTVPLYAGHSAQLIPQ